MRTASTTAAVLAALLLSHAAPASAWTPHVREARAAAAQRAGTTSFAVRSEGRAWGWRTHRTAPTRSLVKALFLVAQLRAARDRPLTRTERTRLRAMVTRSDDAAATATLAAVGPAAVRRVARRVPMPAFRLVTGIWGDSRTDAADQARLFGRIDGLMPARHRAFGLRLLAAVVPSQRWGIGRVRLPPGWRACFKGGWGSGTGESDHQSVLLLGPGGRRVSASVLVSASPSHAYGKRTLRLVFRALLRGLA